MFQALNSTEWMPLQIKIEEAFSSENATNESYNATTQMIPAKLLIMDFKRKQVTIKRVLY